MFNLNDDERVITETAAAFAAKRLAPHALEWDATKHFPTDVLRESAELGMAAIYCRDDVGGSGLRRLDGVRIFEQLAIADPTTAAFLSIHNMCAWMIDTFGTARAAQGLGAPPGRDGRHRELLPHRARRRVRRERADAPGPSRREATTCSTASSSSSPARAPPTCTW